MIEASSYCQARMPSSDSDPIAQPTVVPPPDVIFGRSSCMSGLHEAADRVALLPVPVFLFGATGTGKEVLANYIHHRSPWKEGPFVKMSCATMSEAQQETELFGLEEGAFPGTATKPGLIELSARGTLLLDDISHLRLRLQAKLFQFLRDGMLFRVGAREPRQITTRVVCTSDHLLEREVERGDFRDDLFHRIRPATLYMPPLKERIQDLPRIAEYLLAGFAAKFGIRIRPLSAALTRRLRRYHWPGNIRELENVLCRYALTGTEAAVVDGLLLSSPTPEGLHELSSPEKTKPPRPVKHPEVLAILRTFPPDTATKSTESLPGPLESPTTSRRVNSPKRSKIQNISKPQPGPL